jgi:hypothetical protein
MLAVAVEPARYRSHVPGHQGLTNRLDDSGTFLDADFARLSYRAD